MEKMLSVIIITCNRRKEIIEAIESCVTHTNQKIELVVVDNNSIDGTSNIVKKYCTDNHIPLNYIFLDHNMGVSYARNVGYKVAKGDILFFIDDDAVVISNEASLDTVSDFMRNHEDVMACVGKSIDYRYGGAMSFVKDRSDNHENYYLVRSYVGFNHFIKKDFSQREYLYPNNLFYGSEELYVGLTIMKNGGKIIYISEHVVQHNPSTNTRIDRKEGLLNGHINTYVIKRYFLKGKYRHISTVLFSLRIARFCKFNLHEVVDAFKRANERFDAKYENLLTNKQIVKAIKAFGYKAIL